MRFHRVRIAMAIALALVLLGGLVVIKNVAGVQKTHLVGYFDNSNGLFRGDEIRILGVPVGAIDRIEPQAERVKITFWVNDKYKIPADVKAAIISPQLVTARAIQLTPAYTGGPTLGDGEVIPQSRTAVPLEWDDLRLQLEKLSDALQPTQPGGVSTLGEFVNTSAENLRGQGAKIRDTIIKMSQAFSALGDHSDDTFSSIKNLAVVVSALEDSSTLLRQLNVNLASVTGLLTDDPGAVGSAINDLNNVVGEATQFIADNRETLGTTVDRLASITNAIREHRDDIEETLHIGPTIVANYNNIYQPAQGAMSGALALNNFADPISFVCGMVQAASRLGAEQSSKLCVQYLAPIVKNRQWNFPPLGANYFVGATARPNEITYAEEWMRPNYVPPQPAASPPPDSAPPATPRLPAEAPAPAGAPPAGTVVSTDPAGGLTGMMVPPGGGS